MSAATLRAYWATLCPIDRATRTAPVAAVATPKDHEGPGDDHGWRQNVRRGERPVAQESGGVRGHASPPRQRAGHDHHHHERQCDGHPAECPKPSLRQIEAASDRHGGGGAEPESGGHGQDPEGDDQVIRQQSAVSLVRSLMVRPDHQGCRERRRCGHHQSSSKDRRLDDGPALFPDQPDKGREDDHDGRQYDDHTNDAGPLHRAVAVARDPTVGCRRHGGPVLGEFGEDPTRQHEESPRAQNDQGASPDPFVRAGRITKQSGRAGPLHRPRLGDGQAFSPRHIAHAVGVFE